MFPRNKPYVVIDAAGEELIGAPVPAAPAPDDPATAEDDLATLAREARKSAAAYLFLSRALSDSTVTLDLVRALRSNPPRTSSALDSFSASLRCGGDDEDAHLQSAQEAVSADHSRLFQGSRRVSPLESDNNAAISALHGRSAQRAVMVQSLRDELSQLYRMQDFPLDEAAQAQMPHAGLPVDHICVELGFLAHLSNLCASGAEEILAGRCDGDPEAQMDALYRAETALNERYIFVEDHLAPWAPAFCSELLTRARTDFYRGIAQMLGDLVDQETRSLLELDTTAAM